jgi:hypothetical protein
MYDKDGTSGPGNWVQYYGGHGLSLRIRYLAERTARRTGTDIRVYQFAD